MKIINRDNGKLPKTGAWLLEPLLSFVLHQSMKTVIDNITPLNQEHRAAISTSEAAAHLMRAPQTLRLWACKGGGPIKPLKIHGRLAWPVSEIRRLLSAV